MSAINHFREFRKEYAIKRIKAQPFYRSRDLRDDKSIRMRAMLDNVAMATVKPPC